ncbi:MAG: aminotransferase class V-fold PLP-dependent enzyme [Candidatus Bathyarchaeia archaeon]
MVRAYAEFGEPGEKTKLLIPPTLPFPRKGLPKNAIIKQLKKKLNQNLYASSRNFSIVYAGHPHPITRRASQLAEGTFFADWEQDSFRGTYLLEKEAVRMVGSLLGAPNAFGFITSGGTESNLIAMRMARDITRKKRPEIILPETAHFSFKSAAELLGLKIRYIPLNPDMSPKMEDVGRLINDHTICLVCSAPEAFLGQMDPVKEFSEIALRRNLLLHVDAAFGGFILPFMHELGYDVPQFDFRLPGVTSMMTDGHKLGLLPLTASFFLVRDAKYLMSIPTEDTLIHTITSTKPGRQAACAWTVFKHLGKEGYVREIRHVLEVVNLIADGIEKIEGLRLMARPFITILAFTSNVYDLSQVHSELQRKGWGTLLEKRHGAWVVRLSIHPDVRKSNARLFLEALNDTIQATSHH